MKTAWLFSVLLLMAARPGEPEQRILGAQNRALSPLHVAVVEGDVEKIKTLTSNGADVNAKDNGGYTPLFYAVWKKNVEMARLLLTAGAGVDASDNGNATPLHYAVWFNHADMVELLLAHGADIAAEDCQGKTPPHYAIQYAREGLLQLLIKGKTRTPSIHLAAAQGDLNAVKSLLDQGTRVDLEDQGGWTPLLWAAYMGQEEIGEFLIENGAAVSARTRGGDTPLHQSARAGAVRLAQRFLAIGMEVDVRGRGNQTPLKSACQGGHKDIVALLLAHGADATARDNWGFSPLAVACMQGHREVAELLLAHRADINARDQWGQTALYGACRAGHRDVVELLLSQGADVDLADKSGASPLDAATRAGHGEIAQLLRRCLAPTRTLILHVSSAGDSLKFRAALEGRAREYATPAEANVPSRLSALSDALLGDKADEEKHGGVNDLLVELGRCIYGPIDDLMSRAVQVQFVIDREIIRYPLDLLRYGKTQLFLSKPVVYSFEERPTSPMEASADWAGLIVSDVTADPDRGCLLVKAMCPGSQYFDVWGITPEEIEAMKCPDFILVSAHGSVMDGKGDSMTLGPKTLVAKHLSGKGAKLVYIDSCSLGVSLEFIDVLRQAGTCYYVSAIWDAEAGNSSTRTMDFFFKALLKGLPPPLALFEARQSLHETFRSEKDFGTRMWRVFPFRVYQLN